jgi:hypothetical protein
MRFCINSGILRQSISLLCAIKVFEIEFANAQTYLANFKAVAMSWNAYLV